MNVKYFCLQKVLLEIFFPTYIFYPILYVPLTHLENNFAVVIIT